MMRQLLLGAVSVLLGVSACEETFSPSPNECGLPGNCCWADLTCNAGYTCNTKTKLCEAPPEAGSPDTGAPDTSRSDNGADILQEDAAAVDQAPPHDTATPDQTATSDQSGNPE